MGILKRALRITWRHRALWLFGILLALFGGSRSGGGGGGGSNGSSSGSLAQLPQILGYQLDGSDLERFSQGPSVSPGAVVAILLGVLIFALALIALSIIVRYVSTGALIGMVDEVERTETTSIRSGCRMGWSRFLQLFAISLLLGIPTAIVLLGMLLIILLPLPMVILGAKGGMAALVALGVLAMIGLFLLWFLIALVVGTIISVLIEFMYRRCMLAGNGVLEAIREGFWMVRRNIRDAGITWLLLFGIQLVASIVLIPIALLGAGIIVALAVAAWAVTQTVIAAILTGLPTLLVLIAALVCVQGLIIVFRSTVWTLVYREIDGRTESMAPIVEGLG